MKNTKNTFLALKALLLVQTMLVLVYTAFAVKNEGWDLFTIFTNNLVAYRWNGQFNLDFACYLLLSGLWVMWRSQYTFQAILLGLVLMVLGIIAFAPYILYLLIIEKGDMKKVLVGKQ